MSVVFDFDCTLTVEHMYYFYNDKHPHSLLSKTPLKDIISKEETVGIFINFFFGGRVRLNEIALMLNSLKSSGFHIYISTMGIPEDVKTALTISGLSKYISGVSNHNKADFIKSLYHSTAVYYIDDSANFIHSISTPTVYFGGNDYKRTCRETPNDQVTFIDIRLDREMYGLDSHSMQVIMREILDKPSLCCVL